MSKNLKLESAQSADILLQVPELIKVEEASAVSATEKKELFKHIDLSLKSCLSTRSVEGKSLKKDIQDYLKNIVKQTEKFKKLRSKTSKELKAKYEKKLQAYDLKVSLDEQRLAQEIVIQLDKSDISEEIQRLQAHLKAIGKLINTTGSIGKKLDFYAQELLREVNTVGSKSTSSELTAAVIEAKGLIEKYREQVQNVE